MVMDHYSKINSTEKKLPLTEIEPYDCPAKDGTPPLLRIASPLLRMATPLLRMASPLLRMAPPLLRMATPL